MIVVHPDQCSTIGSIGNRVSEQLVDPPVGLPWTIIKGNARLIVEDWPENAVWTGQVLEFDSNQAEQKEEQKLTKLNLLENPL